MRPSYRADIDGLRAIAIALVLFYHAFPKLFPGGFVGVDVFFVISGFLITRNILAEYSAGKFGLKEFYLRRFRRLFPSLVLVLSFTAVAGYFVLFSEEIRTLSKHIIAGFFFASNFRLLSESGYFDAVAETKPLLHLWSLAIEEQFYLIWPLLILITRGVFRRILVVALLMILASFTANVVFVGSYPSHVFFLPVTRFWEIFLGCLAAILLSKYKLAEIKSQFVQVMPILGLILVGVGCYLGALGGFQFPGWLALLPTLGTLTLILFGDRSWVGQVILSQRHLVAFGMLSYSLYLWHWPLISYSNILFGGHPPLQAQLACVVLSIGFAYLTHQFLELPIQKVKQVPAKSLSVVTVLLILFTVFLNSKAPVINPAPESMALRKEVGLYIAPGCGRGEKSIEHCEQTMEEQPTPPQRLLIGDSKAHALFSGLSHLDHKYHAWRFIGRGSCAPVTGYQRTSFYTDDGSDCLDVNRIVLEEAKRLSSVKTVVLAVAARTLIDPEYSTMDGVIDPDGAFEGLRQMVGVLQSLNKHVILVVDNPTLPNPDTCIPRLLNLNSEHSKTCAVKIEDHLNKTEKYRDLLNRLGKDNPELLVVDPTSELCDLKQGVCSMWKDGKFLYSYTDHLSDIGSDIVSSLVLKAMDERGW